MAKTTPGGVDDVPGWRAAGSGAVTWQQDILKDFTFLFLLGAYMIRRYRHGYIVRTIDIDLRIYDNSDDDNEHHIRKNDTQEW